MSRIRIRNRQLSGDEKMRPHSTYEDQATLDQLNTIMNSYISYFKSQEDNLNIVPRQNKNVNEIPVDPHFRLSLNVD
jgi:hypothetical protein